ncbi:hypothetical protein H9X57_10120 [Flavobacterium piscinae]|nr:hypothetical protein [Flavobacterium piscinae]MBC8883598.1 hypothetical protein [Flavobacterium piscinae]
MGLKMLAGSAVLVVLTFTLLLPVFGNYSMKVGWGTFYLSFPSGFYQSSF